MSDPLAPYRRKPLDAKSAFTAPTNEKSGYSAFVGKDRIDRLRILSANAPSRSPLYSLLLDIVYDGDFGTNFSLVYDFMVVLVRGRNLQSLIMALQTSTADFIQEYSPDRWDKPTDDKTAFIESIEIKVKAGPEAFAEAEKVSGTRH